MKKKMVINGLDLSIEDIALVAENPQCQVEMCPKAKEKMRQSHEFVQKIARQATPVYSINTGFGALVDKRINAQDLSLLQYNLIRSHCTGVGNHFSKSMSRAIMLIRAHCLMAGHSGINPESVQLIFDFLNHQITPLIPEIGSVGASGDLAPLAHLALALIGEGQVLFEDQKQDAALALKKIGKTPIVLGPKEGLALINGTAVMAAQGAMAIYKMENLLKAADIAGAMSLEAVKGSRKAFDHRISRLKPHPGQLACAKNLWSLLEHSEILESHHECGRVQDPYSLRCMPQVHGGCRQTYTHAREVVQTEINSVTDNPLIFAEQGEIISGGNFHGEAIALALDYMAMGLAEIANISERRIEKMVNPIFSGLPAFLIKDSGLNSGLMIAQVTAASLVNDNKVHCFPASVDSVPTSTDKEDHVSMGVTSGRKLHRILENTSYCLAIEFLCNTQALDLWRPLKTSPAMEAVFALIRKRVPYIESDRVFSPDIEAIKELIDQKEIVKIVEEKIGPLS